MNNSTRAILFIHGYMGSRRQYEGILRGLEGCGAELVNLSLPGHEASFEDFMKSRGSDWQSCVDAKLEELRKTYDEIVIVGHSMGGLLAVCSAVKCPNKISRIIAIGFPLSVRITRAWAKNGLLAARKPKDGEDRRVVAARQMSGVKVNGLVAYVKLLPKAMELMKIIKHAKTCLCDLLVPLTIINFKNDEIVAPKTENKAKKLLPSANFIVLQSSGHFLFEDGELQMMVEEIKSSFN